MNLTGIDPQTITADDLTIRWEGGSPDYSGSLDVHHRGGEWPPKRGNR